jgi:acetyl-CoA C-acetyltransferase
MGCQSIMLGYADVIVCGGAESMSNVPYYLPKARFGMKMGDGKVVDGMQQDGLFDPHYQGLMGVAGEAAAKKFNISRQDQDAFARRSYENAAAAYARGDMQWELCSTSVTDAKGNVTQVTADEEVPKIQFDKLAKLTPVFDKKDGTITAANASKISDGASAILLCSGKYAKDMRLPVLARVRGFADAEMAPIDFPIAPSAAIPLAISRAGVSLADIDSFEINEAFSCVPLACQAKLGLPAEKLNTFGGAVALVHWALCVLDFVFIFSFCVIFICGLLVLKRQNTSEQSGMRVGKRAHFFFFFFFFFLDMCVLFYL